MPKRKSRARVRAALAGWITRRLRQEKRSQAAKRGWRTRRRNEREQARKTSHKKPSPLYKAGPKAISGQRRVTRLPTDDRKKARSEAARRGWQTRRRREAKKRLKANQEYYVTVINRQQGQKGKKKVSPLPPKQPAPGGARSHYLPDFIVIQDKGSTEVAIVAYLIYWIETQLSEDKKWWANVVQHAWATQRLLVAAGPGSSETHGVKLN